MRNEADDIRGCTGDATFSSVHESSVMAGTTIGFDNVRTTDDAQVCLHLKVPGQIVIWLDAKDGTSAILTLMPLINKLISFASPGCMKQFYQQFYNLPSLKKERIVEKGNSILQNVAHFVLLIFVCVI